METIKSYLIPGNSFENFDDTIKNILSDINIFESLPELYFAILILQNK